MTTSKEYREYAEECLRWAHETTDDAQQQIFLDMASTWVHAAAVQDGKLPTVLHAAFKLTAA
ncbi:MAG TPA: hypothetical protein VH206_17595 [Xanthobacteraceae bacterium]|jgi:hypothetical protein|nr:hypothetical protein [Xanthobacteraceae bacterium]